MLQRKRKAIRAPVLTFSLTMAVAFYFVWFATFVAVLIVHYKWKNRRFYELYNKIPKADGHLPIIGLCHRFLKIDSRKLLNLLIKLVKPGPSPRRLYGGTLCFVTVDDPDQIQKVCASKCCIERIFSYQKFTFRTGLIASSGPLWKVHRKLIDPMYSTNALRSFLTIFNDKSRVLVAMLKKHANRESFDIYDSWTPFALDNILTTSMGLDFRVQFEKNNSYLEDCKM